MSKFEVELPPALSSFIRRQVEVGLHDTPSDAIEYAVRRLSETDEAKIVRLRQALAPGVAEADAGVFFEGDFQDAVAEARAAHARKK